MHRSKCVQRHRAVPRKLVGQPTERVRGHRNRLDLSGLEHGQGIGQRAACGPEGRKHNPENRRRRDRAAIKTVPPGRPSRPPSARLVEERAVDPHYKRGEGGDLVPASTAVLEVGAERAPLLGIALAVEISKPGRLRGAATLTRHGSYHGGSPPCPALPQTPAEASSWPSTGPPRLGSRECPWPGRCRGRNNPGAGARWRPAHAARARPTGPGRGPAPSRKAPRPRRRERCLRRRARPVPGGRFAANGRGRAGAPRPEATPKPGTYP